MSLRIDLYGQEVLWVKKLKAACEELSDRLKLPEEILLGSAKIVVTAGRKILVENHKGILEYSPEHIVVNLGRGKLCLWGEGFLLEAMNSIELLISGRIQSAQWE